MSQPVNDRVISAVRVISTGSGEQHTEHRRGSRLPRILWVLTSRSWIKAPIYCFAIEHRDGLVLFDTGIDPAIVTDPNYISSAVGRFLLHRIFRFDIGPEDALDRKLAGLGLAAADVRKAVISHLHFDHIGGIAQIPQADLLVSKAEWRLLSGPHPEREWILREHVELAGARWRQVEFAPTDDPVLAPFDGSYDVMGDGSMTLLPTPGHTPGSMSMLVRSAGMAPLLLVGDLTYQIDLLMRDQVPGTGDAAQLRSSYSRVRALKEHLPDLVILAAHDPAAADALRAAVPAVMAER